MLSFVVLNKDDPSFDYISQKISKTIKIVSYSTRLKDTSVYSQNYREGDSGSVFEVIEGVNSYTLESNLLGEYNVSNILAAIACCREYGVDYVSIKNALQSFKAPKGRLEKIENNKGFEIYIDFAHTSNSLEQVLSLLKKRIDLRGKKGKLITIFGCAGERDELKRPIMGEISATIADISIFTAEDPRSEKVENIIEEIVKGAKKSGAKDLKVKHYSDAVHANRHYYLEIPERGEAISFALQKIARKGDTILICGKGHEKSMAYNGVAYAWSDEEAVKLALKGDVKEITRSN